MYKDWEKEAKYLQDELDRERYDRQQEQAQRYEQQQEARRERERNWQEAQCYADSWEDAFEKAIRRYRSEAQDEKRMIESGDYPGFEDTFFQNELEQTLFAQQVYREEMARMREVIARLEQRARNRVAKRVEEKYPDAYIVGYLREDNFNSLVEW